MADITSLVQYYVNLLIIQYHNQPKAQATIQLLAQTMLASGVAIDVENAYNINTAVGAQLDVIGKYVGVNRYFSEINLINYFAVVPYSEYPGSLPATPPAFGANTYATFGNFDYNGTLYYGEVVTSQNALSDANFRTLIYLAILIDNINFSNEAIDAGMWALFGGAIRPEVSAINMFMIYFITGSPTTLTQAIIAKGLLPKPMGVGLQIVQNISGNMFAMTDYAGDESPFGYGFATYSNYATLAGQVLTYSQISES